MNPRLDEKEWDDVVRCLNIVELAPKLVECGLLSIGDPLDNTHVFRTRFVSNVRLGGENTLRQFTSCFDVEKDYEHMGHAYIACLLHGKLYANEGTMRLSSEYKRVFSMNMTKVVELLNVKCLIPQLIAYRLITPDEATSLHNDSKVNTLNFFTVLESKGPTAFNLLVKCIDEDNEHTGHWELHTLIVKKQEMSSPSPKRVKPAELTTDSPLSCQKYHDRRHEFEKYYHSGQWDRVDKLAQDCMKSSVFEVQVIGHLELALSYIFRLKEDRAVHHISKAEDICKTIENSNRTFLSGCCKYLLALLYHYLDDSLKAKKYVTEAEGILFAVEVGEDRSFAIYCDAIISAANLTDKSSKFEFTEVTCKFETALSYSLYTYDMDILVIYCFLRLGRLYLGTTATKVQICANEERIQQSKDCQQKLTSDYYANMDERCKVLYYLNECDLHMSVGQMSLALDSVKQAQKYAELSRCPVDIQAAKIRLKSLSEMRSIV